MQNRPSSTFVISLRFIFSFRIEIQRSLQSYNLKNLHKVAVLKRLNSKNTPRNM